MIRAILPAGTTAFFYANPLQQRVPGIPPDPDALSPRAATGVRARWFEVSCCPTNLARTLASLGGYTATQDKAGVRIELITGAEIGTTLSGGRRVGLRVTTEYPWRGWYACGSRSDGPRWRVSVRVPGWASGATLMT